MQAQLSGKTALVTGASSGIGQAIALALARSGARVVVNYRKNRAGASETLGIIQNGGGEGWIHQADVSDPPSVREMIHAIVEREQRIDILVNNAGDPVRSAAVEQCTPELWDQVMAINLRSVFLCSQAVLPLMAERNWGRIINISSIGAAAGGSPQTLPYAAAKGGVETFTRGLARVAGKYGITVNAVSPGSIATGMQRQFVTAEYVEGKIAESALRRIGVPGEVAPAVVFLASADGAFITGQVLRVDGGRRA
jgi:3-oxoacyl-[acyl-carrier protein] reductase